jgi:hypothetical protein
MLIVPGGGWSAPGLPESAEGRTRRKEAESAAVQKLIAILEGATEPLTRDEMLDAYEVMCEASSLSRTARRKATSDFGRRWGFAMNEIRDSRRLIEHKSYRYSIRPAEKESAQGTEE